MNATLRRLATIALLGCSPLAWPAGPAGPTHAIPAFTVGAGAGDAASATYRLSGSLGAAASSVPGGSAANRLRPGFLGAVVDLTRGCLLDVDGNGTVDALTDGLMVLRAMFGLTGTAVTNGAVGANAQFTTWAQIQPRIRFSALDVDGNGTTDALTDGLMIVRAMFGLTGTAVTSGAVAAGAPRATWGDIRAHLNATCAVNFGS